MFAGGVLRGKRDKKRYGWLECRHGPTIMNLVKTYMVEYLQLIYHTAACSLHSSSQLSSPCQVRRYCMSLQLPAKLVKNVDQGRLSSLWFLSGAGGEVGWRVWGSLAADGEINTESLRAGGQIKVAKTDIKIMENVVNENCMGGRRA